MLGLLGLLVFGGGLFWHWFSGQKMQDQEVVLSDEDDARLFSLAMVEGALYQYSTDQCVAQEKSKLTNLAARLEQGNIDNSEIDQYAPHQCAVFPDQLIELIPKYLKTVEEIPYWEEIGYSATKDKTYFTLTIKLADSQIMRQDGGEDDNLYEINSRTHEDKQ